MAMLEALMMSIDFSDEECDAVRQMHSGHDNNIRLLHYPSMPEGKLGMAKMDRLQAHRDFSSVPLM